MWQPRWALVGDSIQAWVLEAGGLATSGQASLLTASRIPFQTNVSIQNLSTPGIRLAAGAYPDANVFDQTMINKISGGFGMNGVICTLGTNDYSNAGVTTVDYFYALNALMDRTKALGIPLVIVSPIWRADKDVPVAKSNGTSSPLADFQNVAAWVVSLRPAADKVYLIDGSQAPVQAAGYFGDGLHLNGLGHTTFSNWLVAQMKAKGLWV